MSYTAEFTPAVVRITASGSDLQRLASVMALQWGHSDRYARDAATATREGLEWFEDLNRTVADLLVDALENEDWEDAARQTRRAVKLLLAYQLRARALELEAEAAELTEAAA